MTISDIDMAKAVAAVERELDADMNRWIERWTFPGGAYDDAPPPPGRYRHAPAERIVKAVVAAIGKPS